MYLIVQEIGKWIASPYQLGTVGTDDIQLHAIRPRLFRYGSPTGTLQIQILDVNLRFIQASSETITISTIGSNTYWHGWQRFNISTQLKANTTYAFQIISGGGYSFSESAWVGWANDFDMRRVTPTYTPRSDAQDPRDAEVWEDVNFYRRTG